MPSPRFLLAALAVSLVALPVAIQPVGAQRLRDQGAAFKDAQRGRIMPLPVIEQRAREHPALRGATRLYPEFNEGAASYRLKFMRGGRLMWVDVDGRTGRVVQTSDDRPGRD
jgi:hypothetical protein